MSGRLDGKVALITGAAHGIGARHAEVFASEGAAVILADALENEGTALAARLRKKGLEAVFQILDVSNKQDWEASVIRAVELFGKLTTLVNVASICDASCLQDISRCDWSRQIELHLTSTFLGMRAAMPALISSGSGSVVNICAFDDAIGTAALTAYRSAKGGLRRLSKAGALEYAPRGVRVNTVFPGAIKGPARETVSSEENANVALMAPIMVNDAPSDLAYGSLYLASDEARYVTGAEFTMDEG
jgi:NAD(P)-dependent dehydrogenase (short-subunit alcohol dehydrogenase family)